MRTVPFAVPWGVAALDLACQVFLHLYYPSLIAPVDSRFFSLLPPVYALAGAWAVIGALVIWSGTKNRQRLLPVTYLCAGVLANSVSLVVFGYIHDYLPVLWWWTNLADLLVLAGVAQLLLRYLSDQRFQSRRI